MTRKYFTGKRLALKSIYNQRFECFPLSKKLKSQNEIARNQFQGLDKVFKFYAKENDQRINKDDENYNKSSLSYDNNPSF